MQLTAAQIQVITALAGAQGVIPELPDPFQGWFATEKEESVKQASILLVREKLAMYQDGKLLLRDDVHALWQTVVQYQHVFAVSIQSNLDVHTQYVMYRSADPQQSMWIDQAGLNVFAVSVVRTERMFTELHRVIPVAEHSDGEAFRIASTSVKRMLVTVGKQRSRVYAYDITNHYRGESVERHRVMFLRNAWWYVREEGEDSYFTPLHVHQFNELLAHCLRTVVPV